VALIIKPKRGTSTPTTSDIVSGEIAIDTSAQLLYINDNGSIKTIGDGTGSAGTVTEAFKTISVSGQSDVVADTATDTLTLVAGTGMTLTTNASGDSITFASSGSTQNLFETIAVSGQSSVVADSSTDTLTLAAGTGMTITTDASTDTITFASTGSYSDSDVDTHLNTSTAATNEVLSWNGSDYDWVAQTGGSGSTVYQYADAGMVEYEYTASSNQTTFSGTDSNSATLSYTANSIMVFLNGVLQDDGVDYTATNGTSVVFSSALAAADEVRIIAVSSTATLHNPTKLDSITTVNSQAAYSLTLNSAAYTPSHVNALIVSVNGITQEPGDSFTISGSTITFDPALSTGDVVDYIVDMGRKFHVPEWDGDFSITNGDLEVTGGDIIGDFRGPIIFKAQASEALSKGDVVYISGISGQTPTVGKANASSSSTMPAFGLVQAATSSGNSCTVVTFGTFIEYDTSTPGWSLGDTLYVSASTAGALTNSAPAGESNLIQNIGKVQRVDSTDGRIKVGGAGRTNATPNLNDGNIFIGNSSNQVTTSSFNTLSDARISAASIGDLSDVTLTSPSNGQVLKYNGSAWVNSSDSVGATVDDATALAIALG
jgi:hypothetical protein